MSSQTEPVKPEVVASNDPAAPEVAAVPPPPVLLPTPGEFLRAAREKSGLSIGDLATRLRMGARQIEALEKSDYGALPTGTFLRGFVRNYAKAVGADAEQSISLLEKSHAPGAKSPTIVVPSQNIKIVPTGSELATPKARLLIVVCVVTVLAGAAWYWWEYIRPHLGEGGREPEAPRAAISVEQPTQPAVANVPSSAPATSAAAEPGKPAADAAGEAAAPLKTPAAVSAVAPVSSNKAAAAPVSAAQQKPETPAPAKPAATRAAGSSLIGFTFTGESWVEVRDATGKLIVSRRYKAGEAEEAVGQAPFSVVVGNADVTRMAYNGREFDLGPHKRLSVARVTVK